jgi:hypothetical protein
MTPLIEARMNWLSSYITSTVVPGGSASFSLASSARTPFATESVLAVDWRTMPSPIAVWPDE